MSLYDEEDKNAPWWIALIVLALMLGIVLGTGMVFVNLS